LIMPKRVEPQSSPVRTPIARHMRGLYAILDLGTLVARRLDPIAFADAVLSAEPAALQLRAKDATARETLALLRVLAPMCKRSGVPLIANDRPDLAVAAGCDFVHVGQDDMSIGSVRQVAPDLGVGISTHTTEQLESALSLSPSYVAFGPVFQTVTKKAPAAVVGIAGLRAAHARAGSRGVPLVAIGGISHERAQRIVGLADAIAVISELLPPVAPGETRASEVLAEVSLRARALHELFAPGRGLVEDPR